jgi:hypothetical protein
MGADSASATDRLDCAVRELAREHAGDDLERSAEWRRLLDEVAQLGRSRYALLGRPGFIDRDRLAALVAEAGELRGTAQTVEGIEGVRAVAFDPGPAARRLAVDRDLTRLVERELGIPPRPPRQASYQYYDWPGAGLMPHLDKWDVVVSMVVMLEHEPGESDRQSAFVFHPAGRPPMRIGLSPGEVIAFEGRGLVHERERVCEGERVTILVIGTRGSDS